MDKKILERVLGEYGATHLGYYVALNLLGPKNPTKMAEVCQLSVNKCRNIERDLVNLGVIKTEGVGRNRRVIVTDSELSPQAVAILDKVAALQGHASFRRTDWYDRQLMIAEDLIKDFGAQAVAWMVEYIIKVKELKIYSLNLVYTLTHELLPKYQQALQAAEIIKNRDGHAAVVDLDKYIEEHEQEREQEQTEDLPDVRGIKMDFGIEL